MLQGLLSASLRLEGLTIRNGTMRLCLIVRLGFVNDAGNRRRLTKQIRGHELYGGLAGQRAQFNHDVCPDEWWRQNRGHEFSGNRAIVADVIVYTLPH